MQFLLLISGNNTLQCLNLLKSCVKEKENSSLLNRLREGKHTPSYISTLKERVIQYDMNNPINAHHLFIQNVKVD